MLGIVPAMGIQQVIKPTKILSSWSLHSRAVIVTLGKHQNHLEDLLTPIPPLCSHRCP